MPRKSRAIVVGAVVAKVVEQQKGIELARLAEAEGAAQLDPGALDRGLGLDDTLHWTNGHDDLTSWTGFVLFIDDAKPRPHAPRTAGRRTPRTDRRMP